KNSRWPIPQSGAVRNSSGPATPWLMPSANVAPMWCRAKSEKGVKLRLFRPAISEVPEVSVCEWQRTQPTPPLEGAPNSSLPRAICAEIAAWVGVLVSVKEMQRAAPEAFRPLLKAHCPGVPFSLIKRAKFSIEEDTLLVVSKLFNPGGFAASTWVLSSGSPFVAQPSP